MSVALYMDHHIMQAITDGPQRRGVDVVTCADDGTAGATDDQILERASQLGRAVFTQDDDFLVLADEWLRSGREFAGLIFAEHLGITIGQAIRDLELIAKVFEPALNSSLIEYQEFGSQNSGQQFSVPPGRFRLGARRLGSCESRS